MSCMSRSSFRGRWPASTARSPASPRRDIPMPVGQRCARGLLLSVWPRPSGCPTAECADRAMTVRRRAPPEQPAGIRSRRSSKSSRTGWPPASRVNLLSHGSCCRSSGGPGIRTAFHVVIGAQARYSIGRRQIEPLASDRVRLAGCHDLDGVLAAAPRHEHRRPRHRDRSLPWNKNHVKTCNACKNH
jgi:hypothetical protein